MSPILSMPLHNETRDLVSWSAWTFGVKGRTPPHERPPLKLKARKPKQSPRKQVLQQVQAAAERRGCEGPDHCWECWRSLSASNRAKSRRRYRYWSRAWRMDEECMSHSWDQWVCDDDCQHHLFSNHYGTCLAAVSISNPNHTCIRFSLQRVHAHVRAASSGLGFCLPCSDRLASD